MEAQRKMTKQAAMLDFGNAVACHLKGHQLERHAVVEPDIYIMAVKIFVHKTAKNVGVNTISQSKDNHELEKLF